MTPPPPGNPDDHGARMLALAARYQDAFAAGDLDAMRACYAPNATIVQVVADGTLTVDQSLRVVRWLHRRLPDLRLTDARTTVTTEGFVQQYVINGTTEAGTVVRSPTCLVVTAGPSGITRLEEYFDRVATEAIS